MRVVAYCRVSSASQTYATQRSAIEQMAKARGLTISEWYAEKVGGAKSEKDRPELARLLEDARLGKIGLCLAYRYDRISRGGIRSLLSVIERLAEYGCRVESVADGFSMQGPAAEIVMACLAFAGRMELEAIRERQKAAQERLRLQGRSWGRPSRLTRQDREKIAALSTAGHSIRSIAVRMKVPRATVGRAIKASQNPLSVTAPESPSGRSEAGPPAQNPISSHP